MIKISRKRIFAKALSWRLFAATLTFLLIYFLSKTIATSAALALVVSGADFVIKFIMYYAHEMFWANSKFGVELDKKAGVTVLFSGLPCSGKTTIAKEIKKQLEDKLYPVEHLDGDIVRKSICADLGFSKADRDENIKRVTLLSSYLSQNNITLCTFVSPYQEARNNFRKKNPEFVEVYVNCPVEECKKRDVKGMYAKALKGEIKGFTGVDDPYEEPTNPDIICYTKEESIEESAKKVINYLKANKYI